MPNYVVERVIEDNFGSIKGKKVQVIGVSYKPNVADVRETPAKLVIDGLKSAGALVTWHDPVVGTWAGEESSTLGGAEIAVVVTLHAVMSHEEILKSAPYVFDTTGQIKSAKWL